MSVAEWRKKIKKWLEEGLESSDFFTNIDWEVTEKENNQILLGHSDIPYNISMILEDSFLSLTVFSGIETAVDGPEDRLKVYRKMLIANDELKLVKLVLGGRNDELVIRTDLDLATLGKEEFYDALLSVIIGAERLKKILGLEDGEESEELTKALVSLLKEMGKDSVIEMLVTKGGMNKEEAATLVESIIEEYGLEPPASMYG